MHTAQRSLSLTRTPSNAAVIIETPKRAGDFIADEVETNTTDAAAPKLGTQIYLISVVLALSIFLVALDTLILSTAIPKITDAFHSLKDIGWYGSAYQLTTAIFQLFWGKCYSIFDTKKIFLTSIFIFEASSALCGAAPTSIALIIGRALAGIGSAGIFAGATLIVAQTIPLRWRALYQGMFGALFGIASATGPLLGGVLTDKLTWRWCFYINLPFGAITVAVVIFCLHPAKKVAEQLTEEQQKIPLQETSRISRTWTTLKAFDPLSSLIVTAATITLILGLQWADVKCPWSSWLIILLLIVGVACFGIFIWMQIRAGEKAFLPIRILAQRSVAACAVYVFISSAAFFVLVTYLPIYFQAVKGVSAVQSGLMNLPLVITLVGSSLIGGGLVAWLGQYGPLMLASSVIMPVGCGLMTTFTPTSSAGAWAGFQVVYGIGNGLGMQQPMVAIQTVLQDKDIPMGIAMIVFAQTLGGALFSAVGQTIFAGRLKTNILNARTSIDGQGIIDAGVTSFRTFVPQAEIPAVTRAYNLSLRQTFYVAAAAASLTIIGSALVEWKSVKTAKKAGVDRDQCTNKDVESEKQVEVMPKV